MNCNRASVHIRLRSPSEAMDFIQKLSRFEDVFSIVTRSGRRCVNAKSLIGVICAIIDCPDELYLVNESKGGVIPTFVEQYRVLTAS